MLSSSLDRAARFFEQMHAVGESISEVERRLRVDEDRLGSLENLKKVRRAFEEHDRTAKTVSLLIDDARGSEANRSWLSVDIDALIDFTFL